MSQPWFVPSAAYVHVPFCAHQCGYCDFAVATNQDHQIDLYLDSLEAEIAASGAPHPVSTVFVGGGTPTHLNTKQLDRLFLTLRKYLPLLPEGEFSVEANPDDLSPETIYALRDGNVTRVSIGVQSFDERHLPTLDRRHRAGHVADAVARAREHLAQVSLDLIFAVPGQTLADWEADLARAVALSPDHVSAYGLTFEKGTPLWKQRERGRIRTVDEEDELAMYVRATELLESSNYDQYEISNFAKPGKRCRHNEVYWANHAHFGFGMGAAGYVGGVRSVNTRSLHEYIKRALSGEPTAFQSEELAPRDRAVETMAIQLRRSDGIHRTSFAAQTGFALDSLAGNAIAQLVELELLADDGATVRLTPRGRCVADGIVEKLMTARPS